MERVKKKSDEFWVLRQRHREDGGEEGAREGKMEQCSHSGALFFFFLPSFFPFFSWGLPGLLFWDWDRGSNSSNAVARDGKEGQSGTESQRTAEILGLGSVDNRWQPLSDQITKAVLTGHAEKEGARALLLLRVPLEIDALGTWRLFGSVLTCISMSMGWMEWMVSERGTVDSV